MNYANCAVFAGLVFCGWVFSTNGPVMASQVRHYVYTDGGHANVKSTSKFFCLVNVSFLDLWRSPTNLLLEKSGRHRRRISGTFEIAEHERFI